MMTALIFLAMTTAAMAAEPKLVGLVEIPKIFGKHEASGPPGQTPPGKVEPVLLRAEPKAEAKVVYKVTSSKDLVTREHAYEELSAVVIKRTGNWLQIETPQGAGWLAPQDSGTFHAYEELVTKDGTLTEHWDFKLYEAPGGKFERIPVPLAGRHGIDVLDRKTIGGARWWRVQVVEGRCLGKEKPGKVGWVRAYSDSGQPNFWFPSRGC